jgi:hypothetical protein
MEEEIGTRYFCLGETPYFVVQLQDYEEKTDYYALGYVTGGGMTNRISIDAMKYLRKAIKKNIRAQRRSRR